MFFIFVYFLGWMDVSFRDGVRLKDTFSKNQLFINRSVKLRNSYLLNGGILNFFSLKCLQCARWVQKRGTDLWVHSNYLFYNCPECFKAPFKSFFSFLLTCIVLLFVVLVRKSYELLIFFFFGSSVVSGCIDFDLMWGFSFQTHRKQRKHNAQWNEM